LSSSNIGYMLTNQTFAFWITFWLKIIHKRTYEDDKDDDYFLWLENVLRCFHGTLYTKRSHSLTIFIATHFLGAFLDIWEKNCDIIMLWKVDNIVNFRYVVKLTHIWTIQWLIGVHFWFARISHKDCNKTKGLRNITFNGNLFMKFFTYKEIISNPFHENFQFVLKTWCLY
jgi:hypothetical protein